MLFRGPFFLILRAMRSLSEFPRELQVTSPDSIPSSGLGLSR